MSFSPNQNAYTANTGTTGPGGPGNVHFDVRAPTASDVNYFIGSRWIDVGVAEYVLVGQTSAGGILQSIWVTEGVVGGALNTLSDDSSTLVTPVLNNIQIAGTNHQIATTAGSGVITLSFYDPLIAPGAFKSTTTTEVGTNLTVDGTSTFTGLATFNGGVSFASGTIDLEGTVTINTAGSGTTTIGNASAGAIGIVVGSAGNFSMTAGSAGATMTFGSATQTGAITIGDATNATGQTINIQNAASIGGANVVNILSGATPAATQTLNILAGVASAGNEVFACQGGNISQGTNTATFFGGGITGGTNSFDIFSGVFTGGTNAVNIFSNAFTTVAATFNLFSGASTSVGTANIGTGTSAAHVTKIGSNAGGNVTIISGSGNTIGIGLGGNAAQIITIGAAAQTGLISMGTSTASSTVDIMDGVAANATTQTLNIASASTVAGTQVVNLLNGATPASTSALTLNVMAGLPSGASTNTCNFFGGAYAHGTENFNLFNGAIAAGSAATSNVFSGAIAGGTNTFNLFAGANSGGTNVVNIASNNSATQATSVNICTGTGANNVVNMGQYITTKPAAANTVTTAFGASLTAGSATQNTTGYDVLLSIVVQVSSATTATLTLGVGTTNAPTANTAVPSFTVAAATFFTIFAYVPNNYYVKVDSTGTPTITNITVVAMGV